MAKRPFISKGIDELEQLFKSSGTELLTLNALENELIHRSTPRAVSLLKAVRKSLFLPEFKGRAASPNLFDPQPVGWILKGALAITSREKGTGWTLGPCKSPQVINYFAEQPSEQPFGHKEDCRLLTDACKLLILLVFWWTR